MAGANMDSEENKKLPNEDDWHELRRQEEGIFVSTEPGDMESRYAHVVYSVQEFRVKHGRYEQRERREYSEPVYEHELNAEDWLTIAGIAQRKLRGLIHNKQCPLHPNNQTKHDLVPA